MAAPPRGPLPPLGAEADNETADAPPAKPRRRRQQRAATNETGDPNDAAQDANDSAVDGTVPPAKPRRRRPRPVETAGADEPAAENADEAVAETTLDGTTDGVAPQRRRKRKKKAADAADSGAAGAQRGNTNFALDLNLDDLKDDIVVLAPTTINVSGTSAPTQPTDAGYARSAGPPQSTATTGAVLFQPQVPPQASVKPMPLSAQQPASQNDTALYVEGRSRFRKTDKDELQKETEARLQMQIAEKRQSLLETAVLAHVVSAKFAQFCQGLLAGFALWHIVVVAVMMNTLNYTSLQTFVFQFYGPISNGASALYLILLYFATLNTLDRLDIASISKRCGLKCVTFQIPGICIVLYVAALVMQMVCMPIEDQIAILYLNSSSANTSGSYATTLSSSITQTWYPVSIARASLVIIAWLLLAVYPYKDRLKDNLRKHKASHDEFEAQNLQPIANGRTSAVAP